jgi:hypothetical protein
MSEVKLLMWGPNGLDEAVSIEGTDSDEQKHLKVRQIIIELMSWYEQTILGDVLVETLNEFDVRTEGFGINSQAQEKK